MDALQNFLEALRTFVDAIGSVDFAALAIALAFHLGNLVLRTRGWRAIVAASYPDRRVRWRWTFGAYCAGVGINSITPGRLGDAVKLVLLRRRVQGSTFPTLASGLVAETLFDLFVGVGLLIWAVQLGVFPSLPDIPAFDLSWATAHPLATGAGVIVAAGIVACALILLGDRVRAFWDRVSQGLAILRTPGRYLRSVVSYQATGWGLRIAAAYWFLQAFHVPATLRSALLVLVVQGISTALPLTPGGLGPKQALLVVLLAGQASRTDILAFSVGMELAVLVFNLLLGLACAAVMLRGFRLRGALADARRERDGLSAMERAAPGALAGPPGAATPANE
jgi:glycosyltransferase 2 family protein